MVMSADRSLHYTDDADANRLNASEPMALLIGFVLDQQVPVQKAFSGPLVLQQRIGTLDAQRIANVRVETADAFAWDSERRFDAICVGGAVDSIPGRFVQWLKPDGRMFVVRGRRPAMEAVLLRNQVNAPRIDSLFETDLPYLAGAAPAPEFKL